MTDDDLSRTRFDIRIGYDIEHTAFEKDIINSLSKSFGGCTVNEGKGYWVEGATETQDTYCLETLGEERCFQIEVSVFYTEKEVSYDVITETIADGVATYGVSVNWVHVEAYETEAFHFSVDDILERRIEKTEKKAG